MPSTAGFRKAKTLPKALSYDQMQALLSIPEIEKPTGLRDRALMELFRVMAPHGRLFILINLYKDNPYSLQWVDKLKVPVQVRSAAEYVELLKKHAFENVEWRQIPDDTPTPDDYKTKSFNSLDDLKAFKRAGALLLMASKPDLRTPAPGYTIY